MKKSKLEKIIKKEIENVMQEGIAMKKSDLIKIIKEEVESAKKKGISQLSLKKALKISERSPEFSTAKAKLVKEFATFEKKYPGRFSLKSDFSGNESPLVMQGFGADELNDFVLYLARLDLIAPGVNNLKRTFRIIATEISENKETIKAALIARGAIEIRNLSKLIRSRMVGTVSYNAQNI